MTFQDNRFIPVMPSHAVVGYGHSCATTQLKIFKLFDSFGKYIIYSTATVASKVYIAPMSLTLF